MKLEELNIQETPLGDLKRWIDKSTHQGMYDKAADQMYKILKRKEQENGGKWRHTLGYYAMQIGRSFKNVDYKNLYKTFKDKYGDEFPSLITELHIDIPSGEGMGIPRKKMPQIKSTDYPDFIDYLKDNGATFKKETVPATSLKPVQKEFSKAGVERQMTKLAQGGPKKPVIASSDDYIMDGHHRWLVALNTRDSVEIFRVNKPGTELLELLLAYPKVYFKDIYNEDDVMEAPLVAKQSHIFHVVSTLADRKDNKPFPIKFYDGGTMDVTPSTAKRIIDLYYRAEDEIKKKIMQYMPTYNGFKEIAKAAGAVKESAGVGKITKQNSTADVKPGETERQAKKFFGGNGKPKPLGVKGATPHQAFNLGMTENMSVTGTQRGKEARRKKLKPGTEAWFKHWFSLPLMKREHFEQAKAELLEYAKQHMKEGYRLQLERGTDMDVLHIVDTKSGKRTEVRGKTGYESGNYDPEDRLHKLLDKIGKAANISELINGEPVGINPNHPDGASAKKDTDVAFNESTDLDSLRKFVRSQREAPDQVLYQMMMAPDTYGHAASNFVRSWYEKTKEENGLNDVDSALEIMVDELGLNENFKDGKKPGRKGLAKRSGVDCTKSITDLRKIAKNSSGEKQRMAHWCANMKSGRKKS